MTDLAPNYTGTLVSYLNTVGNFTGFLSPLVTSAILARHIFNASCIIISIIFLSILTQICKFYASKFTKAAQIHFSIYAKILASHNNQVRDDEDEKDRKSIMAGRG